MNARQPAKRPLWLLILVVVLSLALWLARGKRRANNLPGGATVDRHNTHLVYTRHARCRMNCRHIDESEVLEIWQNGRVNEAKSEPAGRPDPKYAIEGTTHDGQQVRIVYAPSGRGIVVVTVIDLDRDWECDCK